jgi:alpha-glucoside transport system permease protein
MNDPIIQTFTAVVVSIAFCLLYFAGSNLLLDKIADLPFATKNRREGIKSSVRPWLFLAPALLLLGTYLFYPLFETFRLSFYDATGEVFVGLTNYQWVFADQNFFITIRNNFLWLLVVPATATAFRQVHGVYAHGYQLCGRQCDLEVCIRFPRTRFRPNWHFERHGHGHGLHATSVGHGAFLE